MTPNDWDSVWMLWEDEPPQDRLHATERSQDRLYMNSGPEKIDVSEEYEVIAATERSLNPQASRESPSPAGQEVPHESPSIGGGAALSGEHGAQGDPATRLSSPDETLVTKAGGSPPAPPMTERPASFLLCACGHPRILHGDPHWFRGKAPCLTGLDRCDCEDYNQCL